MTESRTQAALPGADFHLLKSNIADDEFEVSVAELRNELESGKRLLVVYMLDANLIFASVVQTAWLMMFARQLPEMIVVGIGRPVGSILADPVATQKYVDLRTWHLTPTAESTGRGGGAEKYLGFIRDELIPFVDSNYPTNPEDRTLLGGSLSGLFSLYVLLRRPEAFNRYVAGSPALGWDNAVINQYEREFAVGRSSLPVKLFTSVASDEPPIVTGVEEMVETLKGRNYAGLELTLDKFDGETHVSVSGHTMSRGLRSVFKDG